jgi:hypothetical protein
MLTDTGVSRVVINPPECVLDHMQSLRAKADDTANERRVDSALGTLQDRKSLAYDLARYF